MKLLLVEDEKRMALAVAKVLRKNNYIVDTVYDGEEGLEAARTGLYDILILDIMLPGMDGINVLKTLRSEGMDTPVILLTAKGDTDDKVAGLDSGADDYLPKPFQTEELLARLRALGRRRGTYVPDSLLCIGDIELNYSTYELNGSETSFRLTPKESGLLELLMINVGGVVSTNTIIEKLWGWDSEAEDSHVQVQISFLRKKLALISDRVKIRTVYGVGYMLVGE